MRIRFTIRDLLWLTALVAMALAWWIDHDRLAAVAAFKIKPLDPLHVEAGSPRPNAPITGLYIVDPFGMLNLGPHYGKVKVGDLSLKEAESAVLKQLRKVSNPTGVSITIGIAHDS
jgi:protein involved in polysaccharide export with SLBB domain